MLLPLGEADVKRMSPSPISRITFGVRYEPQYTLRDRMGSVVDAILRSDGTPFSPEVFPLSTADTTEQVLLHPTDGSVLRISHQDTILQLPMDSRNLDWIHGVGEDFERFVLRPLREISRLSNILRYGVLLNLDNVKGLKSRPIQRYVASEFQDANTLVMRFSRRLPAEEALVRKRVEDYRNAIYNLKESEDGTVAMSIDYQEYFKPPLDAKDWADKPFSKFVSRGLGYFESDFNRWFGSLAEVAEVA